MEKGHIELGELLVIAILIAGIAAAAFVLTGAATPPGAQDDVVAVPSSAAVNDGVPENASAAPADSDEAPEPAPVAATLTSQSVGELLDDGLGRADARFYTSVREGTYNIHSYRWAPGALNASADILPLKQNDLRTSSVRFNGRYEDSLRGAAFKTYEVEGLTWPSEIMGVLVFLSEQTQFDSYFSNQSEFTIQYDPHPERIQQMERCRVLESLKLTTEGGSALSVYDFSCKIMYGVSS
jgi:hypothetical protein